MTKDTILLVDDNLSNLAVLFDHLDIAGYHVLVADNGIDAVEQTVTDHPDLILLDVRMPTMDGYETCRAIKANPVVADIPIIFLSALTDTDDRLKGFEAGGVDYVTKPVDAQEVVARIRTHIMLARLQRELTTMNEQLEETVSARTVELNMEIEQRRQQEAEKEQLLGLVREQNQQLFHFTNQLLQARPLAQVQITQIISQQFLNNLATINVDLHLAAQQLVKKISADSEELTLIRGAWQRMEQLQRYLRDIAMSNSAEFTLPNATPTTLSDLSKREREVLTLLCDGLTTAAAGKQLGLTDITVRSHRIRIMRKLNINHLPGLVKFALRHNLTNINA